MIFLSTLWLAATLQAPLQSPQAPLPDLARSASAPAQTAGTNTSQVNACVYILKTRADFIHILQNRYIPQTRYNPNYANVDDSGVLARKVRFLIPAWCDMLLTQPGISLTVRSGAYYMQYAGPLALQDYGAVAIPRLADMYVDPRIFSAVIVSPADLGERRDIALSLLLQASTPKIGVFDGSIAIRKQGEVYASYARRMRALVGRVGATTASFPAPALDTGSPEQRERRACEILLALEGATDKPLTSTEEAKLVTELCTLRPPYSAEMLVSYLDKPIVGLDKAQLKGALVAMGDEAIPEVLRFLRADKRTLKALQEGISLLGALCKSPDATRVCLLQAAKIDEEGAKRFKDLAVAMATP